MSDGPLEPLDSGGAFNAIVVDLAGVRMRRGRSKPGVARCKHRNLTYCTNERRVWCDDCVRTIDAFDALMVVVDDFEKMQSDAQRKLDEATTARTSVLHRIAAKKVESAWSGREMAICCPHCNGGILPEDWASGGNQTSREYEIARRRRHTANTPEAPA